jgi:hypothetical protein
MATKTALQEILVNLRPQFDCVRAVLADGDSGVFAVDASVGQRGCRGNTTVTLREITTGKVVQIGWRAGTPIPVPQSVELLSLTDILALAGLSVAPALAASVEIASEELATTAPEIAEAVEITAEA